MKRLKRLFSTEPKKPAEEDDLKSLKEYEIYCSPCNSSFSSEEPDGDALTCSLQRGRHQLVVKRSEKEIFTQEIFIHQPPSLICEPIYDRTITGPDPTWRIALDKAGEKMYTTNNEGCGAYSIFALSNGGKGQLLKTVQCSYIWNIRGIAVDSSENVYLSGDHKVQKYDAEGTLIGSFGWYEPGSAWYQFNDPNGLCCCEDRVYICDSRNQRVQVLSLDLEHLGVVGNSTCLTHPEDLSVDEHGHIHVLDSGRLAIVVFDSDGTYLHSIAFPDDIMLFPVSLCMIVGNYYVSDLAKSLIAVFSPAGELLHQISLRSREEVMEDTDGFVHVDCSVLQRPLGLAVDMDGYIYVSNVDSKEIQVF